MPTNTQDRLAEILKQKLQAAEVRVESVEKANEEDGRVLRKDLGRGRMLVVVFDAPPVDIEEKRQTLETLVDSFEELLAEASATAPKSPKARLDPAEALKVELSALAGRAGALVALVIDAASPIVWGASEVPTVSGTVESDVEVALAQVFARLSDARISWLDLLGRKGGASTPERKEADDAAGRGLRLVPPVDELASLSASDRQELLIRLSLARNAIARIRKSPSLALLHKGEHFHEAFAEGSFGYWARSFATIYVLVLVFPGPFDELGAERAASRALGQIERLVVALPPDDSPTHQKGAVVALRRRRR